MIYIVVFFVFILFVILMSISMIFKNKPIAGSCGGLNNAKLDKDGNCLTCGNNIDKKSREKIQKKISNK